MPLEAANVPALINVLFYHHGAAKPAEDSDDIRSARLEQVAGKETKVMLLITADKCVGAFWKMWGEARQIIQSFTS